MKKRGPVIPLFLGYGLKRYCPDSRTGEKKRVFSGCRDTALGVVYMA